MLELKPTTTTAVRAVLEGEAFLKHKYYSTESDFYHLRKDGSALQVFHFGTDLTVKTSSLANILREFEAAPDRFEIIERAEFAEALRKAVSKLTLQFFELL